MGFSFHVASTTYHVDAPFKSPPLIALCKLNLWSGEGNPKLECIISPPSKGCWFFIGGWGQTLAFECEGKGHERSLQDPMCVCSGVIQLLPPSPA